MPGLLEDGSLMMKGASPYSLMLLDPSVNVLSVVVNRLTVRVVFIDAAVY